MAIDYAKLAGQYKTKQVPVASPPMPQTQAPQQQQGGGFMSAVGNFAKGVAQSVVRPVTTPVAGLIAGVTGKDVDWGGWGQGSNDLDKQSRITGGAALEAAALLPAGKALQGLRGLKSAPLLKLAGAEAGYGALTGAASGAGAELSTNMEASAGDVFLSGLLGGTAGAVLGAGVPLVARGAGAAARGAKNQVAKMVGEAPAIAPKAADAVMPPASAVEAPKMTLREKAAGIKPSTKNIILDSDANALNDFDRHIKISKEAALNPRAATSLEETGVSGEKALTMIRDQMGEVGKAKGDILKARGGRPIEGAADIVKKFDEDLESRFGGVIQTADDGSITIGSSQGRRLKMDEADAKLLGEMRRELVSLGDSPSAQMVDDTVDYLQSVLFKRQQNLAQPVDSSVVSFAKKALQNLNEAQQNIVGGDYIDKNMRYRELKEMFDWLNKNLGQGGSKGASLMKRVFSPADAGTKKMFEKIREATGVDLVREATFAKLAMELVGDARQANLLEQMQLLAPQGAGSLKEKLIGMAAKTAQNTFANPEDVIRDMITKNMPKGAKPVATRALKEAPALETVTKQVETLYKSAPEAKEHIDTMADEIAAAVGGKVIKAPLKGRERALEKVMSEYEGDASQLTDIARNTILVNDEEAFNKAVEQLNQRAWKMKVTAPGGDPSGYSGANAKVRTPNGMLAEIQINTPDMIFAKEPPEVGRRVLGETYDQIKEKVGMEGGLGHKFYERSRSILDKNDSQIDTINNESRRYYSEIRQRYRGTPLDKAPQI